MTTLQRAIQTLTEAESTMKRLIGEAAAIGEYSSVETLLRWAVTLGSMCAESSKESVPSDQSPSSDDAVPPVTQPAAKPRSPPKSSQSKRRSYPVFAKSGDVLIKIAWSKSSKSEYQHKSPRLVASKLADALARHSRETTVISMDKILPLKADDGTEIPDYQVYVSLAWLRRIGAVKQNGRQGYTIENPDDLPQQVQRAWSDLPEATPH